MAASGSAPRATRLLLAALLGLAAGVPTGALLPAFLARRIPVRLLPVPPAVERARARMRARGERLAAGLPATPAALDAARPPAERLARLEALAEGTGPNDPWHAEALFESARLLEARGEAGRAVRTHLRLLAEAPESWRSLAAEEAVGRLRIRLGDPAGARRFLRGALQVRIPTAEKLPEPVRFLPRGREAGLFLELARALAAEGKTAEARTLLATRALARPQGEIFRQPRPLRGRSAADARALLEGREAAP